MVPTLIFAQYDDLQKVEFLRYGKVFVLVLTCDHLISVSAITQLSSEAKQKQRRAGAVVPGRPALTAPIGIPRLPSSPLRIGPWILAVTAVGGTPLEVDRPAYFGIYQYHTTLLFLLIASTAVSVLCHVHQHRDGPYQSTIRITIQF